MEKKVTAEVVLKDVVNNVCIIPSGRLELAKLVGT